MARSRTTWLPLPMKLSKVFDGNEEWWNYTIGDASPEDRDTEAMSVLLFAMRGRSLHLGFSMPYPGGVTRVRYDGEVVIRAKSFDDLKKQLADKGLIEDDIGLTPDWQFTISDDTNEEDEA